MMLCPRALLNLQSPPTIDHYPLSLHDALPICPVGTAVTVLAARALEELAALLDRVAVAANRRSEEHTSELQSLRQLVCRLLLEQKRSWVTTSSRSTLRTDRTMLHTTYQRDLLA